MNEIQAKLEALKDAKYKLLLIVGTPGTGKSKLIHDYSRKQGFRSSILTVSLEKKFPMDQMVSILRNSWKIS